MDRWTGILKVPVYPNGTSKCRVAASLCISPSSKELIVPTANAIFFNGDRVEGTGNPVIERLSNMHNIAEILVSKFGASINAWVIEASTFNGPFAVYKEFFQSLNRWGEPQVYKPNAFPASMSVIALLTNFLLERKKMCIQEEHHQHVASRSSYLPQTFLLGFSKGGVVLNQLVTELGFRDTIGMEDSAQLMNRFTEILGDQIVPSSRDRFFDSITQIHYIDVGLNSPGAYLTDDTVINSVAQRLTERDKCMRFVLHGTPRQWRDMRRPWICEEKNKLRHLLEHEGHKSGRKLEVCERNYYTDKCPDMQIHFEIIEELIVT